MDYLASLDSSRDLQPICAKKFINRLHLVLQISKIPSQKKFAFELNTALFDSGLGCWVCVWLLFGYHRLTRMMIGNASWGPGGAGLPIRTVIWQHSGAIFPSFGSPLGLWYGTTPGKPTWGFQWCRPLKVRYATCSSSLSQLFASWWLYPKPDFCLVCADTCTLVACSVCVEAMHRVEYETWHGAGTFPCRAAAPRKLRRACYRDGIWAPKDGANVDLVLKKLRELGGVRTTN